MSEFSEQPQADSDLRIRHDAELLRHGAVINEAGRLVITAEQEERLASREPYAPEVQAWLDTDLNLLYDPTKQPEKYAQRYLNTAAEQGFRHVRQVLAVGRNRVNLGPKGEQFMAGLLNNEFGIAWQPHPGIKDILKLCRSLDEVPARAIHTRLDAHYSVQDIVKRIAAGDDSLREVLNFYTPADAKYLPADAQAMVVGNVKELTARFVMRYEANRTAV